MSRRRRHQHEDHANHEAWVIPYADLLTLLLALFVVLYAMSTVNVTKYRALSAAISAAFNGSREVIHPLSSSASQSGVPQASISPSPSAPLNPMTPIASPLPPRPRSTPINQQAAQSSPVKINTQQQDLERIRSQVERALQPLIDKNMVVLRRTTNWLEIEIRTDILFPSGVAKLSPSATGVLSSLGEILAPFANPLRVEGYTDDVPINTAVFPSNWELSAARAASVARLFAERGVAPDRLGIIGWGEYHPAADNVSQDGRNRNRRVLVVVLSDRSAPTRFYSNPGDVPLRADAPADAAAGATALAAATVTPAAKIPSTETGTPAAAAAPSVEAVADKSALPGGDGAIKPGSSAAKPAASEVSGSVVGVQGRLSIAAEQTTSKVATPGVAAHPATAVARVGRAASTPTPSSSHASSAEMARSAAALLLAPALGAGDRHADGANAAGRGS